MQGSGDYYSLERWSVWTAVARAFVGEMRAVMEEGAFTLPYIRFLCYRRGRFSGVVISNLQRWSRIENHTLVSCWTAG